MRMYIQPIICFMYRLFLEFEFVLSQLHQALMKKAHTEHKLNQDTVLSDAMTVLPF